MSALITRDPIAIQYLMNETLFKNSSVMLIEDTISGYDEPPLAFWGSNTRNILFLVDNPDHEYFAEEAETAFLKTLSALKLSIDAVAVFNKGRSANLSFEELKIFFSPKVCIFLGKNTWESDVPEHTISQQNGIGIVNTYSFEEMLNDGDKKRMFWKGIKELGIK